MKNKYEIQEMQFKLDCNNCINRIIINKDSVNIINNMESLELKYYNDIQLKSILHLYFSKTFFENMNPSTYIVFMYKDNHYDKKFTLHNESNNGMGVIVVSNNKQLMLVEDELVGTFNYTYEYSKIMNLGYY